MKFFFVTNDIVKTDLEGNPTWTDEPLWLRNEIDTWKEKYGYGGRCWATEDARRSLIISPNEGLADIAEGVLEEITEEQFDALLPVAFPPTVRQIEGEPEEIIVTTKESILKTFWGYSGNHTGTISANEVWTLATSPHTLTGHITIAADVTLTWDPGIVVYNGASWQMAITAGVSGSTTFYAVGTPSLPITYESNSARTGTGTIGNGNLISSVGNNSTINIQYTIIANPSVVVVYGAPTNSSFTFSNNFIRDIFTNSISIGDTFSGSISINNCTFARAGCNGSGSAFILLGVANTGAGTITFNDCRFSTGVILHGAISSGVGHTINFNNCYFDIVSPHLTQMPNYTFNFYRCVFVIAQAFNNQTAGSNPHTYTECIFTRSAFGGASTNVSVTTFANCDSLDGTNAPTNAFLNNNAAGTNTIALTECAIAGHKSVDIRNFTTASQVSGTFVITNPRSSRNFPFTQSNIAVNNITSNSATISWTGNFRTRHRVRLGVVSGTYPICYELPGSWANTDGLGQWAISPSIPMPYLTPNTTYYYVCESYDLALFNTAPWVTSAEGTFTTLSDKGHSPRLFIES